MNNQETNPINEVEDVKEMNFLQKAVGIITSPAETMKNLIAKPRILFPILLMLLAMPIFYLARFSVYKEFLQSAMEAAMAQQGQTVDPSQMGAILNVSAIVGVVTSGISQLFTWLIITAIIFGVVKIFKGQGTFKQFLSVTGYAYVITAVSLALSAIVSLFTGQLLMDSSLANISNLFAPDIKGTYLYGIIRGFDLFTVWYYAVMAVGVGIVSRLGKGVVYTLFSVIFIATLLLGAGSVKML